MYSYSYRLGYQSGYWIGDEYCPFPLDSYESYYWWEGFFDGEEDYYYG